MTIGGTGRAGGVEEKLKDVGTEGKGGEKTEVAEVRLKGREKRLKKRKCGRKSS